MCEKLLMAEQTQEQLLEEQKKNCIFCKIIAGQIPSKKVYEDDKFLAILDINPVVSGHVLLMAKEHIPILAIMPEDLQRNLFSLSTRLAKAVQDAMISQKITIVCQSGYAAGQRPPFHVMLHLLPREKGDGLDKFDLEKQDVAQSDALALVPLFEQTTRQVIAHLGREELLAKPHIDKKTSEPEKSEPEQSSAIEFSNVNSTVNSNDKESAVSLQTAVQPESDIATTMEFSSSNDALEHVLAMSPDLRNFIIMQPDLVEDYIRKSPKLKKLFEGVNLHALSSALRAQDAKSAMDVANASSDVSADKVIQKKSSVNDQKELTAKEMNDKDLFGFIESNNGLKVWLLEHPQELADNLDKNPKLQQFFYGIDLIELSKKYRGYLLKGGRK